MHNREELYFIILLKDHLYPKYRCRREQSELQIVLVKFRHKERKVLEVFERTELLYLSKGVEIIDVCGVIQVFVETLEFESKVCLKKHDRS